MRVSDGAGVTVPAALGPGDDDPRSPAGPSALPPATAAQPGDGDVQTSAPAVVVPAPLGPGDEDPRSPARHVGEASARDPLAPGAPDGDNPDEAFHFLAPPPAGPGDAAAAPRSLVRMPKASAETT